jgi:large subunit ribosomal protein L13
MTKTTLATVADRSSAMGQWRIVDASSLTLGRLATAIATVLMGKHKPNYTRHIVINASKVKLTGNKRDTRIYTWYTGFPGGLREATLGEYLASAPEELIKLAVRRMLPKSRLGRVMISRLKVYRGAEHPHAAQQPVSWKP